MTWTGGYTTICRLCLQQDGFLLAIFNNHSSQSSIATTEHRSIQKKIAECTGLEPSSGDGLPPCVCHRCLYKVELCLDFRRQCLISDATLRQMNGQPPERYPTVECNGEAPSDQDSETGKHLKQGFVTNQTNVEDVVMVVDPNMDYDSENESEFEQHTSDNDNGNEQLKNVFMCKYCDQAYTSHEECRAHESTAHNNEIPFRCAACDMGFADRTNYTAHQKSVHGNDKPFGCPQCERSFSRRSDLRKHTVVHTGIKPFTCNICFKSFSRNTNLTKHLRIHSGHKPYVCPQCPKTFISKGDLTRHAIIHSGQKPFACNYCDQSFGRRDKLLRHEKRHFTVTNVPQIENAPADEALRQLDDGLWGDTGTNEMAVKQETEQEEQDDECDSWSGENMVINIDPFGHRQTPGEQPVNSQPLPRIPEHITADSGTDQSNISENIKRYPCLVCNKRFTTAELLKQHARLHELGPKPHACNLCSKSFLRKRELDRHIATHTGMKPFRCPNCDKRFGRKDKLVRHMRIHEQVSRPHRCHICGASFVRKDGLSAHIRTHEEQFQQPS